MKALNLLGATLGLTVIVGLIGLVMYVDCQHRQQIERLSNTMLEASINALDPVGCPDDSCSAAAIGLLPAKPPQQIEVVSHG